ncbi:MAG: cyclic nucleotide-binding domain-containing protein [Chloroflexi bacterium]|nr:cyclic nucleotide-binding domain-containing protein [Chloroflexota bacterium]
MSTADVLRQVWLFSGLDEQQLDAVSSLTFQKRFGPGELIVEVGRTGNGMYAIISGNVEAVKALGTEQERIVNRLGTGEVFGEMALLGEWPRTATVRAIDEVECLGIDRWVFLTQLERHPQVGIKLLQVLAQKLRDSDARLVE